MTLSKFFCAYLIFFLFSGYGDKSVSGAPAYNTSYQNFKEVGLTPQTLPANCTGPGVIRAFGDFSGSGTLDLFTATATYWPPTTPEAATPSIFEFWLKQNDGSYVKDTLLLSDEDGCVHPRKALVADFNDDGKQDVFIACHGFDAEPFPGEQNKIILSQSDGSYVTENASNDVGFFHAASAADLNNDDLPDVIVVNNFDPDSAYILLNQGNGQFLRESSKRLPTSIGGKNYFTVELIDINGDSNVDILLGGHEWEGATTTALLNPGNSIFSSVTPINFPAVANEGVVLDFALTGPPSNRSIWILRTSGGDGTFYQSRTVQRVEWNKLSSSIPFHERPAQWFPWIIPAIVNEENVIASEDASVNVMIPYSPGEATSKALPAIPILLLE